MCVDSQPELVEALPSDNEQLKLQKRTVNIVGVTLSFADQFYSLRRYPDNEKLFKPFHFDMYSFTTYSSRTIGWSLRAWLVAGSWSSINGRSFSFEVVSLLIRLVQRSTYTLGGT